MNKTAKTLLLAALLTSTCCGSLMARKKQADNNDPLSRLNVVILGDSNTWIGSDSCNVDKGWNTWFKQACHPKSIMSYARSGASWTNTVNTVRNTEEDIAILGDNNVIYNQVERLKDAVSQGRQVQPDLILISAGANDAWFIDRRPQAFDITADEAFAIQDRYITDRPVHTVLTLAESVRYGCEMLLQAFPDAQIILLTPPQSVKVPIDRVHRAGDIIEACGHWMSISTIRQDHQGSIYSVREAVSHYSTYDGAHTAPTGARRLGRYLANQIRSLLQY